jgi:L-fuconolactonase
MAVTQEAWLNLVTEEVIEPEIPICDAQISFSDDQRENVIKLAQISLEEQQKNIYDKEKFLRDIRCGHNVLKTVYVEYSQRRRTDGPEELRPIGETEYVKSVAGKYPSTYGSIELAAGMVALANLTLGDAVKPVLEAHLEAGGKTVRGVRFRCVWDAESKIKS